MISFHHQALRMAAGAILLAFFPLAGLFAQQPDGGRSSIHQTESEFHRWDELKIDSAHGGFLKGRELARHGKYRSAAREFRRARVRNKSFALFDLGLLAAAESRYARALSYFRQSYRVRKDSTCLEEIHNTRRLVREHGNSNVKTGDSK